MRIIIEYEASWRNSFLDGSNNQAPGKRKYVGSITALKKKDNQMDRAITKDTVMGVLNRLIGDRRKLYQSRSDENYYFKELESVLSDEHIHDEALLNNELIYLRNLSGNKDKNAYVGLIQDGHAAFESVYSEALWSILFMPLEDLLTFIISGKYVEPLDLPSKIDPLVIAEKMEVLGKLKDEELSPRWEEALASLNLSFPTVEYSLTTTGKFRPIAFYCSAMYLMVERLQQAHDLTPILSKQGLLSGISKRNFSQSDFLAPYAQGAKLVYGNPYLIVTRVKGIGEEVKKMTTASGTLTLNLPLSLSKANELKSLIEDAGVGPFYLGKKGLAYIKDIIV